MSTQLSPLQLTRKAQRVTDNRGGDLGSFRDFWTNGREKCLFVPVADYLAWRGIRVRNEKFPHAFAAKDWTMSYRALAAANYVDEEDSYVKVSTAKILLFEAEFLEAYFNEAKELNTNRALGLDTQI